MPSAKDPEPMIIIQDTREQRPYTFECINPKPLVVVNTLQAGDYSLKDFENQITIERKSLLDAYGTFGRGRQRFQKELERMINYRFAAVIIEADWHTIVKRPPARSRLHPKTVVASIAAWSQRFKVHFWTCPDREFAERWTYRLLERFWQDRQKEKKLRGSHG
jgi:DNA excision repair protein ERCC-4